MQNETCPDKAALRKELLERRKTRSQKERYLWDCAIAMGLLRLPQYQCAQRVLCYLSSPAEVSTAILVGHAILMGKEVAVPRWAGGKMEFCPFTDYQDLSPDKMGLLQPNKNTPTVTDFARIICIVPALAVDACGNRLGYGGGYYDRFLRDFPGFTVALAYQDCLLDKLPTHSGDFPVDCIITQDQRLLIANEGEHNE